LPPWPFRVHHLTYTLMLLMGFTLNEITMLGLVLMSAS